MGIIKESKAPFDKHLNIAIVETEDGFGVKMPFSREITNPHGSIHGGAIVSLADTAMVLVVITKYPNSTFYTTKLEIKFKSSIDKGHIFAKAQLVDKKRNFIFGKVIIKDNNDKIIAQALATFYLTKK